MLDGAFMTFGVGVLAAPELAALHQQALERLAAAFAPYDAGREYLNFTEASTDPARFFRPDAYHRLREVKAAYDPGNTFRANHLIPFPSLTDGAEVIDKVLLAVGAAKAALAARSAEQAAQRHLRGSSRAWTRS